jgi:glycosyltransferase involved in cell wall biosynthesis
MKEFQGATSIEMKICFTLWSTSLYGGVRSVFETANLLSKRGHSVSIVALGGNHNWFPLKVKVDYVKPPRYVKLFNPLFMPMRKYPISFLDFRLYLPIIEAKFNLDLAGRWPAIRALSELIPDSDINVATWFPTAFAVWSCARGRPFYYVQDFWEQYAGYDRKLFQLTLKLPMSFLANSEFIEKRVLSVQAKAKIKVIGAGVNIEVFHPRKKKMIDFNGRSTIMVLLRKEWFKRADIAIEVLNNVNNIMPIHAIFVGELSRKVKMTFPFSLYLKIDDDKLASLYSASDLFLFTSSVEGFALPPLEAMACGTPVVTTDCGGNRDYVIGDYNCLLSSPNDTMHLARNVISILKNAELRDRLIEGGLVTAKNFTWAYVVDKIEATFREKP